MKKIPCAVGNFEQIINDGYHYVDKTRYIAELENWQVPVFLLAIISIDDCYYKRLSLLFAP